MSTEANNVFDWDKVKEKAIELIIYVRSEGRDTIKDYCSNNIKDLKKEVERYFDYIKNPEHPLSYFNGRMSDNDLAKYICQLATTDFGAGNRELVCNLSKKGMKYDFTHLPAKVESASHFDLSPEINDKLIELKDAYYNPKSREENIIKMIKAYRYKNYKDLILALRKENDLVLQVLIEEKEKVVEVGADSVYYLRISQYMDFSYVMLSEFLLYMIISCYGLEQKECLLEIIKYMDDNFPLPCMKENTASHQKVVINKNGDTVSPAPQAFGLRIGKKQIWDEEEQIERVLEDDMRKNEEFFKPPKHFLHNKISEYETNRKLIIDLIGKNQVHNDDYVKLEEAKEFIELWGMIDGTLGNEEDIYLLYMVFREIFINKARLPDKEKNLTALTIARRFLVGDDELRRWDEVFINKKLQRGRFWILGLQDEYFLYNKILQKYRKTLLEVFDILNDISSYLLIHEIGESILSIF